MCDCGILCFTHKNYMIYLLIFFFIGIFIGFYEALLNLNQSLFLFFDLCYHFRWLLLFFFCFCVQVYFSILYFISDFCYLKKAKQYRNEHKYKRIKWINKIESEMKWNIITNIEQFIYCIDFLLCLLLSLARSRLLSCLGSVQVFKCQPEYKRNEYECQPDSFSMIFIKLTENFQYSHWLSLYKYICVCIFGSYIDYRTLYLL